MLKFLSVKKSYKKVLAHSMSLNGKKLSKGKVISKKDIKLFLDNKLEKIYIFDQSVDYIEENKASLKISRYIASKNIKINKPINGRSDLFSKINGLLNYDKKKLYYLNYLNDDLAVAMHPPEKIVKKNELVGNVKVIPYAMKKKYLKNTLNKKIFFDLLKIDHPKIKNIDLIISSNNHNKKINSKIISSIDARLIKFNLKISSVIYCKHNITDIKKSLLSKKIKVNSLVLLYGSNSIVDKNDVIPQGLKEAKGKIIAYGAPTDPGNLLMYGVLDKKKIIGVPGCAKSVLRNGFDLVLEKACFNLSLNKKVISEMSAGGLFKNLIKNNINED